MKKRVAVLGSTGSIGTQTLQVIDSHNDLFEVELLTAFNNSKLLIEQAIQYEPNVVVIGNPDHYSTVRDALENTDIKVYAGKDAINQVVEMDTIDTVVIGIIGIDAIEPIIRSLQNNKKIALANKESIVVAGSIIKEEAVKSSGQIIPIDSEHSAIFQCLMGEVGNTISKIVLTASGGPFLDVNISDIRSVGPEDALKHPNWNMGDKISVDSATLMNKGLEAIEAHWLFNIPADKIEVLIHPQSIIHSLVYFVDGSIKTQLSYPDMRIPIQFALSYPNRIKSSLPELDLLKKSELKFMLPDVKKFRNLALAFKALESGGNMPCILNAANDIAVRAFMDKRISLLDIPEIVEKSMQNITLIKKPSLQDYFQTDMIAREKTIEIINNLR
ncbi:MAG: 1-deoxy-D-xylulose-5-phosphate reductoisomerase [Lentimicrobiaceae bacterium]|jgi:1-deoxy-D-xylulose-5-phosphate reductoisomerase|nr:1-deoxy-D-xylulose-5-phosphate reductoisomerase [Lentimicrobiaceae bacterium]MBT7621972.1 1-deoxy-D-xylulose-5-phosphate reductoisomerase [Lentimicrobiaceae bacterium]